MTRYLEKYGKQWRLVQKKLRWEKQKKEEVKEEKGKKKRSRVPGGREK